MMFWVLESLARKLCGSRKNFPICKKEATGEVIRTTRGLSYASAITPSGKCDDKQSWQLIFKEQITSGIKNERLIIKAPKATRTIWGWPLACRSLIGLPESRNREIVALPAWGRTAVPAIDYVLCAHTHNMYGRFLSLITLVLCM